MSEVLRRHVRDFGFTHSEIARRATRLNQATSYRVIEGSTNNPSLRSITGIVEATALTDADAGVLYRRLVGGAAIPKRSARPEGVESYQDASHYARNALDSGRIRDAAYGVMSMFDLASSEAETADAYEQAGILYLGLGRWDEAQANFESADALIPGNIQDPSLDAATVDRKLTLMTNIGSLMAKRGNPSWALLFGRSVVDHPRVGLLNRGWGNLVLGEAQVALGCFSEAEKDFGAAVACFEECLERAENMPSGVGDSSPEALRAERIRSRKIAQATGNLRWARVHLLYSRARGGREEAADVLAELEAEWTRVDPEASAMAGLFHALCLRSDKRRDLKLRDVQVRAQRQGLGEIAQRARSLLGLALLLLALGVFLLGGVVSLSGPELATSGEEFSVSSESAGLLARGNTGGGDGKKSRG